MYTGVTVKYASDSLFNTPNVITKPGTYRITAAINQNPTKGIELVTQTVEVKAN